ncbi:hypothetical protein Ciccas_009574 [Cichlidogyrus casuarinus]|uniref:Uncharacterized protein n=1 Tax=Cichlidogyrus casuarinus TaxID=1844966 RepID=A0ABD2Q153_9PLAT
MVEPNHIYPQRHSNSIDEAFLNGLRTVTGDSSSAENKSLSKSVCCFGALFRSRKGRRLFRGRREHRNNSTSVVSKAGTNKHFISFSASLNAPSAPTESAKTDIASPGKLPTPRKNSSLYGDEPPVDWLARFNLVDDSIDRLSKIAKMVNSSEDVNREDLVENLNYAISVLKEASLNGLK